MKNTKVLLNYNNKGGIGKSTLSVNMCQVLGSKFGKKALLIDFDSQGNSSYLLNVRTNENGLLDDPENGHPNIGWLIGEYYWYGRKPNYETVKRSIIRPTYIRRVRPEGSMQWIDREEEFAFDLIPVYNKDLSLAEITFLSNNPNMYILQPGNKATAREAFKYVIDVLRESFDYDYVIVDCSPSLGWSSILSLTAGDELLIPVTPDYLSALGLSNIIDNLMDLKRFVPSFHILGVVFNFYSGTKGDDALIQDIEAYGKYMDINILKTHLPRVNQMKRMSSEEGIAALTNEAAFRKFNARMETLVREIISIEESQDREDRENARGGSR